MLIIMELLISLLVLYGDYRRQYMPASDSSLKRGAVWILFLNADGTVEGYRKINGEEGNFTGELEDYDRFGWAVAATGDYDNNGIMELVVSSLYDKDGEYENEGEEPGALWILYLDSPMNPYVDSITRVNSNPTSENPIEYLIKFDRAVEGVDLADFELITTGVNGASMTGVSGSGDVYTVSVDRGTGNGEITLKLVDDDSITTPNVCSRPLRGAGLGNGNFVGETYTVNVESLVVEIQDADPLLRLTPVDTIDIVFNREIRNFSLDDLSLNRDAGMDLLSSAQNLNDETFGEWTLNNLTSLTSKNGCYQLILEANAIEDYVGEGLTEGDEMHWIVDRPVGYVTEYSRINREVGGLITQIHTDDRFGFSIASLGDLDGDGVGDVAVGVPGKGQ